jgi:2-iminobutanoate/2-iminopropanoate deaminase
MKRFNPEGVVKPASNYVQAVQHKQSGERLIISGQLGLKPDGTLEVGMEKQMEQAWRNVFAIMASAGFEKQHLAKAVVYVTEPGQTALYRAVRDRMLDGHTCANTYLQIAGLAAPQFLVEIEAEAIKD